MKIEYKLISKFFDCNHILNSTCPVENISRLSSIVLYMRSEAVYYWSFAV